MIMQKLKISKFSRANNFSNMFRTTGRHSVVFTLLGKEGYTEGGAEDTVSMFEELRRLP